MIVAAGVLLYVATGVGMAYDTYIEDFREPRVATKATVIGIFWLPLAVAHTAVFAVRELASRR